MFYNFFGTISVYLMMKAIEKTKDNKKNVKQNKLYIGTIN